MGYKGIYKVYDETGKCLGQFGGWTADEAIKQCLVFHPEAKGLTAKSHGTMEHRK
jgi:hypothetical protein